jgi:hypothetical protein
MGSSTKEFVWEYLHEIFGEEEIWLENESFQIVCIKRQ